MFFQKSISSALVFGLVLQSSPFVIASSADELAADATQVAPAEQIPVSKPIYHIALTPREVSDLGVEGFKEELARYSEAKQTESTANTVSAVVGGALVLTATSAAYYWLTSPAGLKFLDDKGLHSQMELIKTPEKKGKGLTPQMNRKLNALQAKVSLENKAIKDENKFQANLSRFEKFIYVLTWYAPESVGALFQSNRKDMAKAPAAKAVVLTGAAVGATSLMASLSGLKSWMVDQFVYPISTSDKSRLENAFELVQIHADNSCLQAQTEKSVGADKAMIQSMHFSDDDIVDGRVYLDGKPLTLALAKELESSQNDEYYVFNTSIVCKTGYFSSTNLGGVISSATPLLNK